MHYGALSTTLGLAQSRIMANRGRFEGTTLKTNLLAARDGRLFI